MSNGYCEMDTIIGNLWWNCMADHDMFTLFELIPSLSCALCPEYHNCWDENL